MQPAHCGTASACNVNAIEPALHGACFCVSVSDFGIICLLWMKLIVWEEDNCRLPDLKFSRSGHKEWDRALRGGTLTFSIYGLQCLGLREVNCWSGISCGMAA
jgi:hypothetical protein